jgi:hypothetical protein
LDNQRIFRGWLTPLFAKWRGTARQTQKEQQQSPLHYIRQKFFHNTNPIPRPSTQHPIAFSANVLKATKNSNRKYIFQKILRAQHNLKINQNWQMPD